MSTLTAVVLAAGQGTRMKSALPKMLHSLAGRPLLYHSLASVFGAGASHAIVVVGHGRDAVMEYAKRAFGDRVSFAVQEPQRGTGHAVMQAMPMLPKDADRVLIAYGDTPLLVMDDLRALWERLDSSSSPLAMLTCRIDEPTGYGRILRNNAKQVIGIREQKDTRNEEERAIREVNPGLYCVRVPFLRQALDNLKPNNAQSEYYLTDIVEQASVAGGVPDVIGDASNLVGVNDRAQLAAAESIMYARIADDFRRAGVTIKPGARIDAGVEVMPDAILESGVSLRGKTRIESGAFIDVGCVVTDSTVGPHAVVKPYSVISQATIHGEAQIGPFAHIRPDSVVGERAHVGNFVELKKTVMHAGAKANHLAYLGDGDVGEGANIGAGTIFCNYDGVQKHQTRIGKGAFIGSDSQLVAPVVVGDNAYVATGTTVTRDVPPDSLAIARVRQENKEGYARKLRERMASQAAAKKAAKSG